MSRQEFKTQYSAYRKTVSKAKTLNDFSIAVNNSSFFRMCFLKTVYPVSVSIENHKAKTK